MTQDLMFVVVLGKLTIQLLVLVLGAMTALSVAMLLFNVMAPAEGSVPAADPDEEA